MEEKEFKLNSFFDKHYKDILVFLFISFTFLLFKDYIDYFLFCKIFETPFKYLKPTIYIDIVWLTVSLISFLLIIKAILKKFIVGEKHFFYSILSILVFLYYRCWSDQNYYEFLRLECCDSFKYIDIITFLPVFYIVNYITTLGNIFVKNQKTKVNNPNKYGFIPDIPVNNNETKLWSDKYIESFVNNLIHTDTQEASFNVLLNSEWGSGKTSFLNQVKDNFEKNYKDDIILIDFNAWQSEDAKHITSDFFELLEEKMSSHHADASRAIIRYLNKIDSSSINWLGTILSFFQDNSLQKRSTQLKNIIQEINRKIIVIIDDVDRLSNDEIFELLKLIRNSANFKNLFFIVACDKGYLNEAISKNNEFKYEKYSQKIFQLEINIPLYDSIIYENIIKQLLHETFTDKHIEDFEESIENLTSINVSIRELKSIINNIKIIKDAFNLNELHLNDFISIVVISYFDFDIYNILKTENYYLERLLIEEMEEVSFDLDYQEKIKNDRENFKNLIKNRRTRLLIESLVKDDNGHPCAFKKKGNRYKYFSYTLIGNELYYEDLGKLIYGNGDNITPEILKDYIQINSYWFIRKIFNRDDLSESNKDIFIENCFKIAEILITESFYDVEEFLNEFFILLTRKYNSVSGINQIIENNIKQENKFFYKYYWFDFLSTYSQKPQEYSEETLEQLDTEIFNIVEESLNTDIVEGFQKLRKYILLKKEIKYPSPIPHIPSYYYRSESIKINLKKLIKNNLNISIFLFIQDNLNSYQFNYSSIDSIFNTIEEFFEYYEIGQLIESGQLIFEKSIQKSDDTINNPFTLEGDLKELFTQIKNSPPFSERADSTSNYLIPN